MYPFADVHDQAGLLCQRDERARQNQPLLGVLPANQRFRTDEFARDQRELWLQVDAQFVAFNGAAQFSLKMKALKSAVGQLRGVKLGGVATALLGAIHGNVCVLDQRHRIVTVFREDADANADTHEELPIQRYRCFAQVFKNLVGNIQGRS